MPGILTSFTELADGLRKTAKALPKAKADGVTKAAAILKAAVVVASGRYASRPIANVRIKQTLGVPVATVFMSSRKAHLLDHDTKAETWVGGALILPGALTGRRDRKQALYWGALDRPRSSSHKGKTQGKLMWEKGVAVATPKMVDAIGDAVPTAIIKGFGL